jgi:hypothetical protein
MSQSQKETQDRAEAMARKSEQTAERDATLKAQRQSEADSVEAKTMRLRALRLARTGKPDR